MTNIIFDTAQLSLRSIETKSRTTSFISMKVIAKCQYNLPILNIQFLYFFLINVLCLLDKGRLNM